MHHATPLPAFFVARYRAWRAGPFEEQRDRFAALAEQGQNPMAMIIACCDSRVKVSEIFGAEAGDFFIHRNIANLVPPYRPDAQHRATSATIEYAVTVLKVRHLLVLGHFGCGGVRGCHDMLSGAAPHLRAPESFVGSWLGILAPAYDTLPKATLEERLGALEKQAVLLSLGNLMSFPFVRAAVEAGTLQIHGAWKDIRDGGLEVYDPPSNCFRRI
jgi:carbonic anhydrase